MLDHASIAVSDINAAERFYDAIMDALGIAKVGATAEWIGYGLRADAEHPHRAYLSIRLGSRPERSRGRHWCFKATKHEIVDRFWNAGLQAGGTDEGCPGLRLAYHPSYYAAFLSDPDGNRVEAVCHAEPKQPAECSS